MNKIEILQNYLFSTITTKTPQSKRQEALCHSYGVYHFALLLSKKRHLETELVACISLLHDIGRFVYSNMNHASTSARLASDYLSKENLFTVDEINIITTAIENHSAKNIVHDKYSEVIKDADIIQRYFDEPDTVFPIVKQERINNIIKELSL